MKSGVFFTLTVSSIPKVGWTFLGPVENNMGSMVFVSGMTYNLLSVLTSSHLENSRGPLFH